MAECTISPFTGEDFALVTILLRECLVADAITPELFARKALLDPNFDPSGALVARADGRVAGFLLALARRVPLEDGPDDRERGWITLFAVEERYRRQGVGTALLERAIEVLRGRGCRSVLISPYAPNYWTPGVDVSAYPEAVVFLEKRGFASISRPISMDVSLTGDWRVPAWAREREERLAAQSVRFLVFRPPLIPGVTAFLRAEFPGDWQRYVRETMTDIVLGRRSADDLQLAYDRQTLVGFSQHEGERFGPFGVGAGQRGRGIGAVLMFHTLETMRRKGHHTAWFLWTDDATAERVYHAAGFRATRRYAVMRREI